MCALPSQCGLVDECARTEKCTKREWNDEYLLVLSLLLALSPPLELMQHYLLVLIIYGVIECVNSTSILKFEYAFITFSPRSLSMCQQATGNWIYKPCNTQFIGRINSSQIIWCLRFFTLRSATASLSILSIFQMHVHYSVFTLEIIDCFSYLEIWYRVDNYPTVVCWLWATMCDCTFFHTKTCPTNTATNKMTTTKMLKSYCYAAL